MNDSDLIYAGYLMLAEDILEDLPCGCIVFDANGRHTFVNSAMCEMVAYTIDRLLNLTLEDILTVSSRIFYQTYFFSLLKVQGSVNEIFLSLRSASGTAVPVMVNVRSSERNGVVEYVGVFNTVWERRKCEQELIQAKKAHEKALQENDVLVQLQSRLELNQQQLDRKLSQLQQRSDEYLQMGKVLTHDMQEPIRKISFFLSAT